MDQIPCDVTTILPQPLNHVDNQPLEHLSHHLVWTLDQDLHGPPRFRRHVTEEPLARLLAGVELFGEQFHPEDHRRLKRQGMLLSFDCFTDRPRPDYSPFL